MKKLFLVLVALFFITTSLVAASPLCKKLAECPDVAAQPSSSMTLEELRAAVNILQSTLPIDAGPSLSITKITLTDQSLTYGYDLKDVGRTMAKISDEDFRSSQGSVLPSMISEQPFMRSIFQCLADNGMSFRMSYHGTVSGVTRTMVFTPSQLRAALRGEGAQTPLERLKSSVENSRKTLPLDYGGGITMTGIELRNGFAEHIYTCNAAQVNVSQLRSNRNVMRQTLQRLIATDALTKAFAKMAADAGYGLAYIYQSTDTSVAPLRIQFTAQELKGIINN